MWDLWLKQALEQYLRLLRFTPVSIISRVLHTPISFPCYRRYVILQSDNLVHNTPPSLLLLAALKFNYIDHFFCRFQ